MLSVQKSCTDKNHAFDTVYCRWSLTCTGVVCTKNMLLIQSIAGDHLYRCCLYKNHAQTKIMPLILCIAGDHLLVHVLSVQKTCFWYRALQVITYLYRCCLYKIMLLVQGIAGDHLSGYCLYKIRAFDTEHCSGPLLHVLSEQKSCFWYRALQVITCTDVVWAKIILLI